jgi:uncharacterized membrane protein
MKCFLKKSLKIRNLLLIIAFLIITALSLHAVITHDHPEDVFGSGMQAALHGNDKKWWLLLFLAAFLVLFGNSIKNVLDKNRQIFPSHSFWLTFNFSNIFDPIREALRTGILNPKLCE